jgi:hypothetical protein
MNPQQSCYYTIAMKRCFFSASNSGGDFWLIWKSELPYLRYQKYIRQKTGINNQQITITLAITVICNH